LFVPSCASSLQLSASGFRLQASGPRPGAKSLDFAASLDDSASEPSPHSQHWTERPAAEIVRAPPARNTATVGNTVIVHQFDGACKRCLVLTGRLEHRCPVDIELDTHRRP